MSNWLEKWRGEDELMSPERRAMNEALARLEQTRIVHAHPGAKSEARLAFILDLTGSRRASLYNARIATASMFETVKAIGAIAVKLIYYRGKNECRAGSWESDPQIVSRAMQRLSCQTGVTQIAQALRHVLAEGEKLSGVVFIGDHCEDDVAELAELATALGERKLPAFIFHECPDEDLRADWARPIFKHLAEASGGVYCEFQPDSATTMRELLQGVAAFSAAGVNGLQQLTAPQSHEARQLQERLLLLGPGTSNETNTAPDTLLRNPLAKEKSRR
jgi:hypothetical protein